ASRWISCSRSERTYRSSRSRIGALGHHRDELRRLAAPREPAQPRCYRIEDLEHWELDRRLEQVEWDAPFRCACPAARLATRDRPLRGEPHAPRPALTALDGLAEGLLFALDPRDARRTEREFRDLTPKLPFISSSIEPVHDRLGRLRPGWLVPSSERAA